jgi:hypothetical protein
LAVTPPDFKPAAQVKSKSLAVQFQVDRFEVITDHSTSGIFLQDPVTNHFGPGYRAKSALSRLIAISDPGLSLAIAALLTPATISLQVRLPGYSRRWCWTSGKMKSILRGKEREKKNQQETRVMTTTRTTIRTNPGRTARKTKGIDNLV